MKIINYYTILTGGVRVETGPCHAIDIYPITVKTVNRVSGNVTWETQMWPYMWAQSHNFVEDCTVLVCDRNGKVLLERDVDNVMDGDSVQNHFELWSSYNKGALGIVVGAHAGTSGEWVNAVNSRKLNAVLFEPLDHAFCELGSHYASKGNVELVKMAVTVEGGEITFYAEQNCGGYCSTTLLERAKNSPMPFESFTEVRVESQSVKGVLEKYRPRWFHVDAEGLDFDIIGEIMRHPELHPEIIIYEHGYMDEGRRTELEGRLAQSGYVNVRGERLNSIAVKPKTAALA